MIALWRRHQRRRDRFSRHGRRRLGRDVLPQSRECRPLRGLLRVFRQRRVPPWLRQAGRHARVGPRRFVEETFPSRASGGRRRRVARGGDRLCRRWEGCRSGVLVCRHRRWGRCRGRDLAAWLARFRVLDKGRFRRTRLAFEACHGARLEEGRVRRAQRTSGQAPKVVAPLVVAHLRPPALARSRDSAGGAPG